MANNIIPKKISTSLYIDGKPAQNSIKNVEQVTRKLRRELNGLTIGTSEWNAKMRELQVHQRTLTGIRNEIRGVGGAFGWLKTEIGKFGTLAAGYLGFQFMSGQFQNIILQNARLSDSLSSIRRVAEMTEEEVRRLDKSFNDLNTRTSKSSLREMAIIAGRLGVAKDEILGFVEATDMLVVALGDELGNADQITTQLGKILNVFDGEVTGDNITRLGNAMVKLANDGVASAGFISDFTQRVSGMAKTANVGLGAVVGLGAGLEELGARVESSATAVQKLLVNIAQDIPKSAAVAKMPVEEFNALFGKAPEEALLRYAEGLTQNQEAFSDVASAFSDAGENGVRVIETITKLGERADFIRTKFEDGTEALKGYNEIQDAFALMNENAAGSLDRLQKSFNRLVTNQEVLGFMASLIDHAANAVNWIERNSKSIVNFTKVMTIAVASWGAYNLAVKISTASLMTHRTAMISAALAKAIMTGNITKATQAMRLLNIAIKMNPIGFLVGAITAAATAFILFNNKVDDATKIQRNLANVTLEAQKATLAERQAIERSQRTINDDTASRQDKFDAVKTLRDIMPDVLKDYSDEEILAGRATAAIQNQTKSILEQAKARAKANRVTELESKRLELMDKLAQGWAGSTPGERLLAGFGKDAEATYLASINKQIASVEKQIEAMESQISRGGQGAPQLPFALGRQSQSPFTRAVSTRDNELLVPGAIVPGTTPSGGTGGGSGSGSDRAKTEIEQVKKVQEEIDKISQEVFEKQLSDHDREVEAMRVKYERLKEQARAAGMDIAHIEQLESDEALALQEKHKAEAEKLAKEEVEKKLSAEREFYQFVGNARKLELDALESHYRRMLEMADDFGFDKTKITETWRKQQAEINKKYDDEDALNLQRQRSKWSLTDQEYETEKRDFQLQIASQVADATFDIMRNANHAKLNDAISSLNAQRDAELSNENLTQAEREQINQKYEAKIREEKKKAFIADQRAAIAQAVVNGALAATKALSQTGVLAPFVLPAIAATTALQIATIASQPVPEFAGGGFSDRDPEGYVGQATLFKRSASGRPFIAGERGAEWIAPHWMLQDPSYANIIGMLETARQEKRYFAGGGSTAETTTSGSNMAADEIRKMTTMMSVVMQEIKDIKSTPLVFAYKDYLDFKRTMQFHLKGQGKK